MYEENLISGYCFYPMQVDTSNKAIEVVGSGSIPSLGLREHRKVEGFLGIEKNNEINTPDRWPQWALNPQSLR